MRKNQVPKGSTLHSPGDQIVALCSRLHRRHSTAVYLLKSGVDLATISHWLGHASLNTTNRYATIDLEMKRKAIELIESPSDVKAGAWKMDETILEWLESL